MLLIVLLYLTIGSTCFAQCYAHRQELTTVALITTWAVRFLGLLLVGSYVQAGWISERVASASGILRSETSLRNIPEERKSRVVPCPVNGYPHIIF